MNRITLIGMPGSGKTAIGKLLAAKLETRWIDTDEVIEAEYRSKLESIIKKNGEEHFRTIEEQYVYIGVSEQFLTGNGLVVSTGGSVIYSENAMQFLKGISKVVFLDVPIGELKDRIGGKIKRIIGLDGKTIEDLHAERLPFYRRYADMTIDCSGKTKEEITEEIVASELVLV